MEEWNLNKNVNLTIVIIVLAVGLCWIPFFTILSLSMCVKRRILAYREAQGWIPDSASDAEKQTARQQKAPEPLMPGMPGPALTRSAHGTIMSSSNDSSGSSSNDHSGYYDSLSRSSRFSRASSSRYSRASYTNKSTGSTAQSMSHSRPRRPSLRRITGEESLGESSRRVGQRPDEDDPDDHINYVGMSSYPTSYPPSSYPASSYPMSYPTSSSQGYPPPTYAGPSSRYDEHERWMKQSGYAM
jgi:hypothetical protein